ncbi:MAG: GNAT family N-acetyltransferase [Gammaproteobacteria bacterium]|nr:GNAT family N-acetyltransferase [Gammaproteobacteria bacterium]
MKTKYEIYFYLLLVTLGAEFDYRGFHMLRLATKNDISSLNELIASSARALSQSDYSEQEIAAAIQYVFGVDTDLIDDQTYYVIENKGVYLACGGWSKREKLFGGNQFHVKKSGYLDPKKYAAKIRAFFVNPDYARLGLGKKLLTYCEQMALAQGFTKTEMMATLPGVKLYEACGYLISHEKIYSLPNGVTLKFKQMSKNLLLAPLLGDVKMKSRYPQNKLTLVGGGIVAALEVYFAYLDAKNKNTQLRVTINEKNKTLTETTTANIVPSLTPDEILSVVPRGPVLVEKLGILFNQPGGIRIDDVDGVNQSETAKQFITQVQEYSKDEGNHNARTKTLLELGKMSMELWQRIYDDADAELKKILEESNFNPCREPRSQSTVLHDGYRIDLIYSVSNAKNKAEEMKNDYESLGYKNCKILSPTEVKTLDPFLTDFCESHTEKNEAEESKWKNDTVALYRPGGCLDTEIFLPKFYAYLKKVMGQYVNEEGKLKDCFHIKFERHVKGIVYGNNDKTLVNGLRFFNDSVKRNKHAYSNSNYVFCPGEAVGTLQSLGFSEPAYAGFAGASLKLSIPVPADKLELYSKFNHCMEVHQEGVVLAWQARIRDNKIFIGVAGTKGFYSDVKPNKDEAFAKNRNLLQLNMVNDVLPEFMSLALGKNTKGQKLTEADLALLEEKNIAKRWVGTRAVAYDGFPTVGNVYNADGKLSNARTTTHLGSGGASFSPAAVLAS